MKNIDKILADVKLELGTATSKFGKFHSAHEGYCVLLEEVEELQEQVFKHKEDRELVNMRKECIQIAAMACRFITDILTETKEGRISKE